MSKKRGLIAIILIGIGSSIGLIVISILNGKYLEAVAISSIVSTLAWFVLQGKETYQRKIDEREEQAEVRKR